MYYMPSLHDFHMETVQTLLSMKTCRMGLLSIAFQVWDEIGNANKCNYLSTSHSRLTVASIVISKFRHCIILVTISTKSFFQQNFNLIWTRIQHGLDLGCCLWRRLWLGIKKILILGDGSLHNLDSVPNCMALKCANFDWWKHARFTQ
jgi:hypothetical protein